LEPARCIGSERHDEETSKTNDELRHDGIFVTGDDDLSCDSKKRTQTEYLQRVLSAPPNRLKNPPFEETGVRSHHQPNQPGKRQEVNETQDIDVRLVDRIDLPGEPVRNEAFQRIIMPGQGDKGSKGEIN